MKKFSLVLTLALLTYGAMWAQRSISGTIIDQEGLPLIGASVLVKGTTSGTVSDIDGKYTVEVPEGATTLIFSYTGFSTSELEITSADILDVTLQEGVTLNEAVVTALGISREKKALGYSVQDVKGDDLQVARDPNAINALSGKVAGLQIISSSGNVGSSSRVIIRGASSITGNSEPLFVLNGIPLDNTGFNGNSQYGGVDYGSPVSDINPEDIESITVLKGPNAAALYGSRAANGVILINTKTGKNSKSRLGVSYSGNVGFANLCASQTIKTYTDKELEVSLNLSMAPILLLVISMMEWMKVGVPLLMFPLMKMMVLIMTETARWMNRVKVH